MLRPMNDVEREIVIEHLRNYGMQKNDLLAKTLGISKNCALEWCRDVKEQAKIIPDEEYIKEHGIDCSLQETCSQCIYGSKSYLICNYALITGKCRTIEKEYDENGREKKYRNGKMIIHKVNPHNACKVFVKGEPHEIKGLNDFKKG